MGIAAKARDEKLADRQKAPNVAPLKDSQQGLSASPKQQDTWGFFQWDRYATPWEASPALHATLTLQTACVCLPLNAPHSSKVIGAVCLPQQNWSSNLSSGYSSFLLHIYVDAFAMSFVPVSTLLPAE